MKTSYLTMATMLCTQVCGRTANGIILPPELAYSLPQPFRGPEAQNGNFSTNFVNTQTQNISVNRLLREARAATYYAFDEEFYAILGGQRPPLFEIGSQAPGSVFEAGVWVPELNEVWFTSIGSSPPTYVSILDLETHSVRRPEIPELRDVNPNGGYYFNGLVYFAIAGNESAPAGATGIVSVDPKTYKVTSIVNSFFGLVMVSVDDLAWAKPNTSVGATSCTVPGEYNLFFSSFDFGSEGVLGFAPTVLPNAVWRFSPQTKSLQGVISRADILKPNGLRIDPTGSYLYITDAAVPFNVGGGANSSGSGAIYRYDLDRFCSPVNKQMVAIVRSYADGMHIDDYGRIWTAEYDGVIVRDSRGKVLGVFNAEALLGVEIAPIANFALAGDKFVILAIDRIFIIELGQNVTTPERFSVP
ncbi:hypothetical protein BDV06DRAFT_226906 [Aspergillus oleicola]